MELGFLLKTEVKMVAEDGTEPSNQDLTLWNDFYVTFSTQHGRAVLKQIFDKYYDTNEPGDYRLGQRSVVQDILDKIRSGEKALPLLRHRTGDDPDEGDS